MRRTAVAAVVLAAASSLSFAPAASACTGEVCDAVNLVCEVVRGSACVR
jgi:hypothetical protein